ncbi:hypothetical protein [Acrocarpospora phusangensis]|uniref:hypothetical protein n=1 Tax=Acrocarpospora phusangensis TaxID=1070424 RepID=UPI001EF1A209|nr:hypothetical protein [Acrocarpospora phusangensis]
MSSRSRGSAHASKERTTRSVSSSSRACCCALIFAVLIAVVFLPRPRGSAR